MKITFKPCCKELDEKQNFYGTPVPIVIEMLGYYRSTGHCPYCKTAITLKYEGEHLKEK